MSGAIPLLPLYAFMVLRRKKFTFYLLPILNDSKILINNNNNNIYLLQLGCHPLEVVILHVNKT